METKDIAAKLVDLCKKGENIQAVDTLYSPEIVSIEAQTMGQMPAEIHGVEAVRGKNVWWNENFETHSAEVKGPFVNGDQFAVLFNYEVTGKVGPNAGQRQKMEEVALYTAKDGKIVKEQFFY